MKPSRVPVKSQAYPLGGSLGYFVNRASRFISTHLNRRFAEAGLDITAEQWRILATLSHQDGRSHQELAAIFHKDKTCITRLIHGMERRALVVRTASRSDRRQKLIRLTPMGRALLPECAGIVRGTLQEAQKGIPEAHLEVCKAVLKQVFRNLSDSGSECDEGS